MIGFISIILAPLVLAANDSQGSARVVTVHDQGVGRGILTNATSLREAFKEHGIVVGDRDHVEPGLDEELEADVYEVNIYRARPITIIDGSSRYRVETPYQTPKQIAQDVDITLYDEDETALRASADPLNDGSGMVLEITRATPIKLDFFGEKTTVRTMASTVGDFLEEKDIQLAKNEAASLPLDAPIKENMKLALWRNGEQTITRTEAIDFPVQIVEDADKPAGYRKVTTPGIKGEKKVTYKVTMRNGKELKRKAIHTVTVKKPKKQVEVVGTKPSFSGDFAAALAKLRQCESTNNYSINTGNGYYGAYQFDEGTWYSVSNAPYGKATPAEQDAAARKLYERRGWQPWPVCGSSLPDSYR